MHLVWMSLFLPGMLFVVWAFPATRKPKIWLISFAIAILGLAAVIGFDLFGFYSLTGSLQHGVMRAVFAVIMSTNLPLVALAASSVINWSISKKYAGRPVDKKFESKEPASSGDLESEE